MTFGDRFSFLPISLFQQSHSTFVIILFGPSSAVHQPDDLRMSTFPQIDNRSWSFRTSILEGAIFHKMSYCKFLQGNPCKAIETFYRWVFFPLGLRVLDDFRSFCCMKEFGDGFDGVTFPRLFISCNCLLSHTARWSPIANNLQESIVHAASQNFHFCSQNYYFEFPARYFSSP